MRIDGEARDLACAVCGGFCRAAIGKDGIADGSPERLAPLLPRTLRHDVGAEYEVY
jgi:hypothetical protein